MVDPLTICIHFETVIIEKHNDKINLSKNEILYEKLLQKI